MTTSVTRSYFTKQHQTCKTKTAVCKTKTKTTACKTKTKTDFFWSQTGLVLRPSVSDHITGSKGRGLGDDNATTLTRLAPSVPDPNHE